MSFMAVVALLAHAQDTAPAFKKHSVGINHSYDITSLLSNDNEYYYTDNQRVAYGYSAALLYQYRPVQWFSVETGVEYNSTKTRVMEGFPYDAKFHQAMDFDPAAMDMDFTRSINRFAVPLNLRWHGQKGRWGFYGLTGVVFTANHLLQYQFDADFFRDGETYNYIHEAGFKNNLGLGLTAGVGVEYQIKPNWLLRAEPRFRVYNIAKPDRSDIYYQNPPQNHYWAAGLNVGVYYGFGK